MSRRATAHGSRREWRVVAVGYLLLGVAWAMSNPAFSAPDEVAQYTRAASAARGELGDRIHYPLPSTTPEQEWFRRLTRAVDIPPELAYPMQIPCWAFRREVTPVCADQGVAGTPWALSANARLELDLSAPSVGTRLEAMLATLDVDGPVDSPRIRTTTYQGSYPAFVLVPAGLAANLSGLFGARAQAALLSARLVSVLLCAALWAGGLWALLDTDHPAARLLAAAVTLTPMTLFLGSTIATSGLEVAAAFAVSAGVARLARVDPTPALWVLLGAGGVTLACARQAGPVWIAITALVTIAVLGRRRFVNVLRSSPGAQVALGCISVATLGTVAWNAFVMPPPPPKPMPSVGDRIVLATHALPTLGREMIGVFGWLDVSPPAIVHIAWTLMLCALLGAGLLLGSWRARGVLVTLAALLIVAAYVFSVWVANPVGTVAQGRWILPLAIALPIACGEVIAQRTVRLPVRPVAAACVVVVAIAMACQAASLLANAHRYAVGASGPAMFIGSAIWSPPGGWVPWLVMGVIGAIVVIAGAVRIVSRDSTTRGLQAT